MLYFIVVKGLKYLSDEQLQTRVRHGAIYPEFDTMMLGYCRSLDDAENEADRYAREMNISCDVVDERDLCNLLLKDCFITGELKRAAFIIIGECAKKYHANAAYEEQFYQSRMLLAG